MPGRPRAFSTVRCPVQAQGMSRERSAYGLLCSVLDSTSLVLRLT